MLHGGLGPVLRRVFPELHGGLGPGESAVGVRFPDRRTARALGLRSFGPLVQRVGKGGRHAGATATGTGNVNGISNGEGEDNKVEHLLPMVRDARNNLVL